jgi:hypothetical protein
VRFMMLMLPNIDSQTWQQGPDAAAAAMGEYNQALTDAGVLRALDGFHPPAAGARISRSAGAITVGEVSMTPGQTVGGYWIIDVASRDEALDWAARCL